MISDEILMNEKTVSVAKKYREGWLKGSEQRGLGSNFHMPKKQRASYQHTVPMMTNLDQFRCIYMLGSYNILAGAYLHFWQGPLPDKANHNM